MRGGIGKLIKRLKEQNMGIYRKRMDRIRELYQSYEEDVFNRQLEEKTLDDQFEYIFRESQWLEKLKMVLKDEELIGELLFMLHEVRNKIIDYYVGYFKRNRYIGGKAEGFSPDIIIGLGCNNSLGLLDKRIERIAETAELFPDTPVLLSGGGFELEGTEAEIMRGKLVEEYEVDEKRIIMEEDSMDTVGNALFSKLLLKRSGRLKKIDNLLIVTSPFHAVRSGALFRNIFGEGYRILVTGHPYHLTQENYEGYCDLGMTDEHRSIIRSMGDRCEIASLRKKLAEHEIRALYKLNEFFQTLKDNIGDETSIFYELFLSEGIYNMRYDILRKYRDSLRSLY